VVERAGSDPNPIDPLSDEGRLTLSSYVWPDQAWRWESLNAAFELAREHPIELEVSGAADWLEQRVRIEPGAATVVFHSIVAQYLSPEERTRGLELLKELGSQATSEAPFAWLYMEPPQGNEEPTDSRGVPLASIRLTVWPGEESRLIARCGYHGRPVYWLGDRS
jgi:hypothetical protein